MACSRQIMRLLYTVSIPIAAALLLGSGCAGLLAPQKPLGPEAYCASVAPNAGYGPAFYCPTSVANLDKINFPDGSHGYCMYAMSNNLGNVGYSAYLVNGGATYVTTQSQATQWCRDLKLDCPGTIRCTR